jgi:hypothetical protein
MPYTESLSYKSHRITEFISHGYDVDFVESSVGLIFNFRERKHQFYIQSLKEHNPSLLKHSYILSDKDEWLDGWLIGTLKGG